jgi:hypothetical protein
MAVDKVWAGDDTFEMGSDSLAGYLEQGINDALVEFNLPPLDTSDKARQDRTPFILGLANGIIDYLVDHQEAFTIVHTDGAPGGHQHSGINRHDGHVVIEPGP